MPKGCSPKLLIIMIENARFQPAHLNLFPRNLSNNYHIDLRQVQDPYNTYLPAYEMNQLILQGFSWILGVIYL
jgi:hypothetical protein